MIPLKDKNPTHRFPIVTISLVIVNILVFLYEISLGKNTEYFLYQYGFIPSNIIYTALSNPLIFVTIITSIFLHGGWLHLIGNMLYLWVFGDNVEDKVGHFRFIVFYIFCGIFASMLHAFIDPTSNVPTIGASGAISGVLGANILMFPKARIITLIPLFIFIQIAELPAYIILGLWFVLQFVNGLVSLGYNNIGMGGVAWWAHIGGFISGMILIFPFRKYK